jgi:aspartyl protease family protein
MIRIDAQSGVIFASALASSLAAALWVGHMDLGLVEAPPPLPLAAPAASGRDGQIMRSADGHYWTQATINGRAVRVLVDTGASVVALTRDDALRLGFMLQAEDFDRTVRTANGEGRAAAVELAHVAVAGARVERVQALVVERGLDHSLLGMSYLGRLSRFEATPDSLTLRP